MDRAQILLARLKEKGKIHGSVIPQGDMDYKDMEFIIDKIRITTNEIPTVGMIRDRVLYGLDRVNSFYAYRKGQLKPDKFYLDFINDLKRLIGIILSKEFLYPLLIKKIEESEEEECHAHT